MLKPPRRRNQIPQAPEQQLQKPDSDSAAAGFLPRSERRLLAILQRLNGRPAGRHMSPGRALLLVLGVSLSAWWLAAIYRESWLTAERRSHVAAVEANYVGKVSSELNRRLALLEGLRAFVAREWARPGSDGRVSPETDAFTEELLAGVPEVRSMSIAPSGVVQYLNPRAGARIELGQDLLNNNPSPPNGCASGTGQPVGSHQAGSSLLLPEDPALVALLEVCPSQSRWGLVAMEIDLRPILGLGATSRAPTGVRLAARDNFGQPLFGEQSIFESDAVLDSLEVPGGSWEFAAVPTDGWREPIREPLEAGGGLGLLLVGVFAGVAYLGGRRHQEMLETFGTERSLARSGERGEKERIAREERQRLARDLHDSVTQLLYSMDLTAEAGCRLAETGDLERTRTCLTRLSEIAHRAVGEMRLVLHQLREPILEQRGLAAALQHRLESVERRAGLEVRMITEGTVALPREAEGELYRIAQEALNNALRHSAAHTVTVALTARNRGVRLEIGDDGTGFISTEAEAKGGLGLLGMRERAEHMGATLAIASAPGKGTVVSVSLENSEGSRKATAKTLDRK